MVENVHYPASSKRRLESSYLPGQTAYYSEDGDVIRVRILENNCSDKGLNYKLKVEEHISKGLGTLLAVAPLGDVFNCNKIINAPSCFGIWELKESRE